MSTPRPSVPRARSSTAEYKIGSHLFARGGYTYLDAVVQRSFSSESLPSYQPELSQTFRLARFRRL